MRGTLSRQGGICESSAGGPQRSWGWDLPAGEGGSEKDTIVFTIYLFHLTSVGMINLLFVFPNTIAKKEHYKTNHTCTFLFDFAKV